MHRVFQHILESLPKLKYIFLSGSAPAPQLLPQPAPSGEDSNLPLRDAPPTDGLLPLAATPSEGLGQAAPAAGLSDVPTSASAPSIPETLEASVPTSSVPETRTETRLEDLGSAQREELDGAVEEIMLGSGVSGVPGGSGGVGGSGGSGVEAPGERLSSDLGSGAVGLDLGLNTSGGSHSEKAPGGPEGSSSEAVAEKGALSLERLRTLTSDEARAFLMGVRKNPFLYL